MVYILILVEEEVGTFTDSVGKVGESKRVSFKAKLLQERRHVKVACNITPKVSFNHE